MHVCMSCLCRFAALLSCVALAVISLAMRLSTEFVKDLVAVLNVLASQVATALDTLNFALAADRNQESDPRMPPRAPRNSRHGLRPRIITERISSDRSRTPTRTRTRPVGTSSTWYIPALSPPREARREAPGGNPGQRPETLVDRLPPPRPLAPNAARNDRAPGHASSTTPDSDSDGSVRPHPGASSFRPSPTVVHGPLELLQEFTIALRNEYLEPFTAWTQGELDEMVRRKKDKGSRPTYKTIAR